MTDRPTTTLDVETLVAAHSRIVNDFLSGKEHPDWTVLFDWHRDENDEEKTRAAFEAIVREATR